MHYVVSRNKNAISLIDLKNSSMQPLIEIRNMDLFCEKLSVSMDRDSGYLRVMYVSWQHDRTYIKEIIMPETFVNTLRSAADL